MRQTFQKLNIHLLALVLVLCAMLCAAPAAHAEEGQCGDGLTWSLAAGTLTISGSGAMTDFTESDMAPWYELREEILRLSLPEGLTSVGELAFYGCENLSAVSLPDTVKRVGDYAFMDCTGLKMLNLGSGLTTIGEAAFSDCYSLATLSLPASLTTIGMKAFYRCESISAVTVPAGVKSLGTSAFAYCKSLVKATVKASVELPDWLFYRCEKLSSVTLSGTVDAVGEDAFRGCSSLSTVNYNGSGVSAAALSAVVNSASTASAGGVEVVSGGAGAGAATGSSLTQNADGTLVQETSTVMAGENATVSATTSTTYTPDLTQSGASAMVGVAVEGQDGWKEAAELTKNALGSLSTEDVEMELYLQGTDSVDQEFLDAMTGQAVQATVLTQDGSAWKLDFSALEATSGAYDLRYSVSAGTAELCEELGTSRCFLLSFASGAQINAEVLIRLGRELALQNATLFQRSGGELKRVQTVVVDTDGYAHFYLASVDETTEYYIAMGLSDDAAILPDKLLEAQEGVRYQPIQYEITGRTSTWNMSIGQVTWIMLAVIVVCVVGVGGTMFALNRRKLRMGYVPPLDGEDEI